VSLASIGLDAHGRWALVNVTDRSEGDFMLLENFR
jgi:hypothetical protein